LVSWCGNHVPSHDTRPRVGKKSASSTPTAFRDTLLHIASQCTVPSPPVPISVP
jgi:hypothetical protein